MEVGSIGPQSPPAAGVPVPVVCGDPPPNCHDVADRDFHAEVRPGERLFEFREFINVVRRVEQVDERKGGIEFRLHELSVSLVRDRLAKPINFRASRWVAAPVDLLLAIRHPRQHEIVWRGGVKHAKKQLPDART